MSDETQAVENTNQTEAAQQPPATSPATTEPPKTETVTAPEQATQPQAQPADDSLLGGEPPKTEEQKPEGEQQKEEPTIFGAPDEYKFEGIEAGAITGGIAGFTEAVKGLNLNQETAQAILSKSLAGIQADRVKERTALRQETLNDTALNWQDPNVQQQANSAYARFFGASPRIQAKLKALNLDVDREFLGIMQRIGGELSQGSFVQGNKQGSDDSDFRRMYPATKMNR